MADRRAKQACDLLGGRKVIDEAATSFDVALHHQFDILKGLSLGIAACFHTLPKRPRKKPKAHSHDMEHYGSKWKCCSCGIVASCGKECWQLRRKACTGPCAMRFASAHKIRATSNGEGARATPNRRLRAAQTGRRSWSDCLKLCKSADLAGQAKFVLGKIAK